VEWRKFSLATRLHFRLVRTASKSNHPKCSKPLFASKSKSDLDLDLLLMRKHQTLTLIWLRGQSGTKLEARTSRYGITYADTTAQCNSNIDYILKPLYDETIRDASGGTSQRKYWLLEIYIYRYKQTLALRCVSLGP